ncbi:unnamed protein product [Lactuca virosa]|uniref:Uncharacterized protein n=1 Tax=Lactuca virosa TaxID=75947 RepID=A0AAU9PMX7_9ASTR|nr:unnamed protein product [Lactuca virosa]
MDCKLEEEVLTFLKLWKVQSWRNLRGNDVVCCQGAKGMKGRRLPFIYRSKGAAQNTFIFQFTVSILIATLGDDNWMH